jgi:bile acid-coenzyme A ligase
VTSRPRPSVRATLAALARAEPDRPAISFRNASGHWYQLSRLDLYDSVGRTAADITTAEPPSGQVLVDLPNGLDFFVVVLASWAAGRSPVVVPHGSSAAELDRLLGSGALADTGFIAAHGVVAGEAGAGDGWRRFPPHHIDEPDPSWFLPSGGSTGLPTLTPANGRPADLLAGQQLLLAALGWTHDATQLVMGPLNHAAPFTSSVAGLLAGNHLVVLERFNPAAVLDAAVRHQPTWFQATPHQMAILATKSSVVDALSVHLTGMMHTAAPCPQAVKES